MKFYEGDRETRDESGSGSDPADLEHVDPNPFQKIPDSNLRLTLQRLDEKDLLTLPPKMTGCVPPSYC